MNSLSQIGHLNFLRVEGTWLDVPSSLLLLSIPLSIPSLTTDFDSGCFKEICFSNNVSVIKRLWPLLHINFSSESWHFWWSLGIGVTWTEALLVGTSEEFSEAVGSLDLSRTAEKFASLVWSNGFGLSIWKENHRWLEMLCAKSNCQKTLKCCCTSCGPLAVVLLTSFCDVTRRHTIQDSYNTNKTATIPSLDWRMELME